MKKRKQNKRAGAEEQETKTKREMKARERKSLKWNELTVRCRRRYHPKYIQTNKSDLENLLIFFLSAS